MDDTKPTPSGSTPQTTPAHRGPAQDLQHTRRVQQRLAAGMTVSVTIQDNVKFPWVKHFREMCRASNWSEMEQKVRQILRADIKVPWDEMLNHFQKQIHFLLRGPSQQVQQPTLLSYNTIADAKHEVMTLLQITAAIPDKRLQHFRERMYDLLREYNLHGTIQRKNVHARYRCVRPPKHVQNLDPIDLDPLEGSDYSDSDADEHKFEHSCTVSMGMDADEHSFNEDLPAAGSDTESLSVQGPALVNWIDDPKIRNMMYYKTRWECKGCGKVLGSASLCAVIVFGLILILAVANPATAVPGDINISVIVGAVGLALSCAAGCCACGMSCG